MIGVDAVLLGMASFQATFSLVLQWTGRFFSVLKPLRNGPRHCGQSSVNPGSEKAAMNIARYIWIRKFHLHPWCEDGTLTGNLAPPGSNAVAAAFTKRFCNRWKSGGVKPLPDAKRPYSS